MVVILGLTDWPRLGGPDGTADARSSQRCLAVLTRRAALECFPLRGEAGDVHGRAAHAAQPARCDSLAQRSHLRMHHELAPDTASVRALRRIDATAQHFVHAVLAALLALAFGRPHEHRAVPSTLVEAELAAPATRRELTRATEVFGERLQEQRRARRLRRLWLLSVLARLWAALVPGVVGRRRDERLGLLAKRLRHAVTW
mmetsp:Transcript_7581/g.30807  ORF Transcript_7581/g.30807 Transcript_7581/m.30807 type:complete len:201 (-) Transcript_7581:777-1379(-)